MRAHDDAGGAMTPAKFIAKWSRVDLPERAASQEHFLDLCRMLGQPTPAEHDATGAEYTFEKGVAVTAAASAGAKGDRGFADVWWRGKFAWEYKRKDKYRDLSDAYRQLCQYREALENPPLLVVTDIARTEIHTNFTGTAKQVHTVLLKNLDRPESLSLLRRLFVDPGSFRPAVTPEKVTEEVAEHVAGLAGSIQERGHEPHEAAHFLMKCMFCLFAEDVALLPDRLFTRLLNQWHGRPGELTGRLTELFRRMGTGGAFGTEPIPWFNGGLFDDAPALPLEGDEIEYLRAAAVQDWGSVEPAIFGTLFERSLDPGKRAQIGAHYTSRDDIMLIIEPVVMAPLRRRWAAVRQEVARQLARRASAKSPRTRKTADRAIADALGGFLRELSEVRILDPACGSGNFLYVAIQQLLYLEKEVITFAAQPGISLPLLPTVRPTQLHGIEINPYAAELAQVVIWIGYLQWMRDNGFNVPREPILEPLQTIECRDAILAWADDDGSAIPQWRPGARCTGPADWPEAHFIVSNPPFLGSKRFRQSGLPDEYVQHMFDAYDLPNTSDLCCYWFEAGRQRIQARPDIRAGLLATQGIRGGDNRTVLTRIKETGNIFMAWSDKDWVLDGAAVHVSMVGFDNGRQTERTLDGQPVREINTNLTADVDTAQAQALPENLGIAFMGDTKGGAFDVEWTEARDLLRSPNPNGRSNIEVVRPWVNGQDLTRRTRAMWIIDFGCEMPMDEAAGFERAFGLVEERVKPGRAKNRRASYAQRWWLHVEPRPAMRRALDGLERFIVTTRVAKHRLFGWYTAPTLPDSATFCFARRDDYFFGVLHSAVHELWARRMGTQLEDRPRYTPSTCFETFPLPWPPGSEPPDDPLVTAISQAARDLDEQRRRWLNPPEWIEPIARRVDADEDCFRDVPDPARELVRQSGIMAVAAKDPDLKRRTLTNLYNRRPTWLRLAHRRLDDAVLAAYAATDPAGKWSPDWAALWEDSGPGQPLPPDHPLSSRRAEIDRAILESLLRLNHQRTRGTAGPA